jgi:hypothetical protein
LYRAALHTISYVPSNNEYPLTTEALNMWQAALNSKSALPNSDTAALAEIFAAAGDGVLLRLRKHVSSDGWHLFEQLDRNTGKCAEYIRNK